MQKEVTFNDLPRAVSRIEEKMANLERLLLSKLEEPTVINQQEDFLTTPQAAKFLGLSVQTIYGMVKRSEIPVCKRGKLLYFSKNELAVWIKTGRKLTQLEIKQNASKTLAGHLKGL